MWRRGVVDDQMVSRRITPEPTFHRPRVPGILRQRGRAV
jgi:hypothetical protein